jgi:hypothetical protein
MKIDEMGRGGLWALGLLGVAAGAALGFAAGVAVSRDPDMLRRTVRRAARGLETATLMAAQARESLGDIWAEAREAARGEVDSHDFARASTAATGGATGATMPDEPAAGDEASRPAPRKRARRPRKKAAEPDAAAKAVQG